jgi:Tfp pilus assembly protein PilN
MHAPLNLATRPVRNERLPALLFLLAAFALLLVTVQHAVIASRLLPRRSNALREEVASLEKELEQLENEGASLRRITVNPEQKTEWTVLKGLVDRRTFWWSRLLAVLEQIMPREARLTSVAPHLKENTYELELSVRLQNANAGYEFMRTLERRPEFSDVRLKTKDEQGGEIEFQLVMRYYGAADTEPAAPAAASASATTAAPPGKAAEPPAAAASAGAEL